MQFVLMCWRLKGKSEKGFSSCCADSWLENVQSHQIGTGVYITSNLLHKLLF